MPSPVRLVWSRSGVHYSVWRLLSWAALVAFGPGLRFRVRRLSPSDCVVLRLLDDMVQRTAQAEGMLTTQPKGQRV